MENAIRRPDAPNHFMVLKPVDKRVIIRLPDGTMLAETTNAIRLMEAGKTLYDPVLYLPRQDVSAHHVKQVNTTHCPLKGDATYYTFEMKTDSISDLAWTYEDPFDFSHEIKGLMAFYPNKVTVEEHPL